MSTLNTPRSEERSSTKGLTEVDDHLGLHRTWSAATTTSQEGLVASIAATPGPGSSGLSSSASSSSASSSDYVRESMSTAQALPLAPPDKYQPGVAQETTQSGLASATPSASPLSSEVYKDRAVDQHDVVVTVTAQDGNEYQHHNNGSSTSGATGGGFVNPYAAPRPGSGGDPPTAGPGSTTLASNRERDGITCTPVVCTSSSPARPSTSTSSGQQPSGPLSTSTSSLPVEQQLPRNISCQGCGQQTGSELCCPTCNQYGRSSFFCTQECFRKNWSVHRRLHVLLQQQKELAQSETASIASDLSPDSNLGSQGLMKRGLSTLRDKMFQHGGGSGASASKNCIDLEDDSKTEFKSVNAAISTATYSIGKFISSSQPILQSLAQQVASSSTANGGGLAGTSGGGLASTSSSSSGIWNGANPNSNSAPNASPRQRATGAGGAHDQSSRDGGTAPASSWLSAITAAATSSSSRNHGAAGGPTPHFSAAGAGAPSGSTTTSGYGGANYKLGMLNENGNNSAVATSPAYVLARAVRIFLKLPKPIKLMLLLCASVVFFVWYLNRKLASPEMNGALGMVPVGAPIQENNSARKKARSLHDDTYGEWTTQDLAESLQEHEKRIDRLEEQLAARDKKIKELENADKKVLVEVEQSFTKARSIGVTPMERGPQQQQLQGSGATATASATGSSSGSDSNSKLSDREMNDMFTATASSASSSSSATAPGSSGAGTGPRVAPPPPVPQPQEFSAGTGGGGGGRLAGRGPPGMNIPAEIGRPQAEAGAGFGFVGQKAAPAGADAAPSMATFQAGSPVASGGDESESAIGKPSFENPQPSSFMPTAGSPDASA
eukprot:CAMPEP_0178991504 /NCGR_PEP_ID=MMETSP0795-20121207/5565_1 /TAXON_ID=88552 /ORGANISM="Amoebophrya sp., Strain Ameob2" /LENGTH=837 /DNA_ID=CAMNT_0020683221 /DNA_START=146 /DNA_END=2659 /DNA_ORIENTATION=+